MSGDGQPGRLVQRARRDAHRPASGGLPEQARAARAAEPTAGAGVAVRAIDPAQLFGAGQHEVVVVGGGERPDMAVPAPALPAVAYEHVAEWSSDLEADRAAQASAAVC